MVRKLIAQFIEENVQISLSQARMWQTIWPQNAPPPGPDLEVLDPPNFPRKPTNTSPLSSAAVGLSIGLALGLLAAVAMQRPKWTLQMAGFAIGCGAPVFAISLPASDSYTANAVLRIAPPMVPVNSTGETATESFAGRLQ